MAATGTATIDFGATPTDEGSVTVTGQTDLQAADHIEAFVMRDSTADNPVEAHSALAEDINLICEQDAASDRFFIFARTGARVTGTFKIRWAYSGTAAIGNISGGAAGGVLSGTYPDPGFAVDMATQAELDAALVNYVNPACRIRKAGGSQAVLTITPTKVAFDTLDYEEGSPAAGTQWSDANDELVCQVAGRYMVTAGIVYPADTTGGFRGVQFAKNGVTIYSPRIRPIGTAVTHENFAAVTLRLAVNDKVTVLAYHDATSTLNLPASAQTGLEFVRLGA